MKKGERCVACVGIGTGNNDSVGTTNQAEKVQFFSPMFSVCHSFAWLYKTHKEA